jgi:circadian clock protein KaiC
VVLRFFEAGGTLRKAISVIKKRTGIQEVAIREYQLFPEGLRVGPPLLQLQGILSGVPAYTGRQEPLLPSGNDAVG